MQVAAVARPRVLATGPKDEQLRLARSCYDHVAGRLAVAITDAMVERGLVELGDDAGFVTSSGADFLLELGIPTHASAGGHTRPLCRPCLDWSERRPHLAGRLGAALFRHYLQAGWLRRRHGSRALVMTPPGRLVYRDLFGIDLS